MKKNKNAFTLVELLAVIVILAIILVIAVPKVMSIIEDSKKATLENTVKMIASSAEKAKIQNAILGTQDEITCESIANINNVDYANCEITFENDTAKVTIKGSGKFAGLNVCGGTKTIATPTTEICPVEYGIGTTYISKLLEEESELHNGLIIDDTEAQNIRYVGSNEDVKNKVYFNCKDKDLNNVEYGEESYDYANSCEVWRIIGVFDTYSSDNESEEAVPRIKIVRDSLPVMMSWDSSSNNNGVDNNSGWGINQWGASDSYEGADLMQMLNGYYIGKEDICLYCNAANQGECTRNCTSSINPISSLSLSMIDDVLWNLGAPTSAAKIPTLMMYAGERGMQTGKLCISGDYCNDNVTRTIKWIGKIGLIYPSDYGYASANKECNVNMYGADSLCSKNNWLHPNNGEYWTISPRGYSNLAFAVWYINSSRQLLAGHADYVLGVRPTLYLSTNIKIIGGNGDNEPYKLNF